LRVRSALLLGAGDRFDWRKYMELLLSSAVTLLGHFGYTMDSLYDMIVRGERQEQLA